MDRKGRTLDYIYIKRFWRKLKQQYIYLNTQNNGLARYQDIKEVSIWIIIIQKGSIE